MDPISLGAKVLTEASQVRPLLSPSPSLCFTHTASGLLPKHTQKALAAGPLLLAVPSLHL